MSKRPYRVALNGYGRIGRCVFRALHERGAKAGFSIVALNDLADLASLEYLTRFDSTHGRFPGEVRVEGDSITITHRGRTYGTGAAAVHCGAPCFGYSFRLNQTVTSLIAIVPDSEFSMPTLTVSPDVSTHDSFASVSSPAFDPQADNANVAARAAVGRASARR